MICILIIFRQCFYTFEKAYGIFEMGICAVLGLEFGEETGTEGLMEVWGDLWGFDWIDVHIYQ